MASETARHRAPGDPDPGPGGSPGRSGAPAARPDALLLVGPTAAGKTPLGEVLEARGLWGRPCVHFDFGRRLREAAAGAARAGRDGAGDGLTEDQRRLLAELLRTGALLEDEHFPIAARLFRAFLAERRPGPEALVVLNGLPRHLGQAERMAPMVRVRAVVHLVADEATVLARIRRDPDGDRAGRPDDDPEAVRRRLATFRRRTAPLVEWYRERGAAVLEVPVGPETTAEAVRTRLEARDRPF